MKTYFLSRLFRFSDGTLRPCLVEVTVQFETASNVLIGTTVDYIGHYPLPSFVLSKSEFVLHETLDCAVRDLQAQCRKAIADLTGIIDTLQVDIQSFEMLV